MIHTCFTINNLFDGSLSRLHFVRGSFAISFASAHSSLRSLRSLGRSFAALTPLLFTLLLLPCGRRSLVLFIINYPRTFAHAHSWAIDDEKDLIIFLMVSSLTGYTSLPFSFCKMKTELLQLETLVIPIFDQNCDD